MIRIDVDLENRTEEGLIYKKFTPFTFKYAVEEKDNKVILKDGKVLVPAVIEEIWKDSYYILFKPIWEKKDD